MPIIVPCPGCKARLKAPDSAIGRAFMCPNCKTKVQVVATATPLMPPLAGKPAPAPKPAPAAKPSLSPKIKIIEKPLLNQPAPPTRLTVVGEAEQAVLPGAPSTTTPMPKPPPTEEEVFTDFEVVGEDAPPPPFAQPMSGPPVEGPLEEVLPPPEEDGPLDQLDELDEVPDELDELEEVAEGEPVKPTLLTQSVVRLIKKPPPGLTYKLSTATGEVLAMAYAVPLPGSAYMGTMTPVRWEVREGDDEVLRATAQLMRAAVAPTVEVLGPLDEPLGKFAVGGWPELRNGIVRIDRAGQAPLQLVPQPSRRRVVMCSADGRELGDLVPGNGAWFVPGGLVEVRFGPGLAGKPSERWLLLCIGPGIELIERQRQS